MQWIRKAEPIAYGALNLKPWEFEELTPREFDLLCDGYEMRAKELDTRLAYFFTMATNVHLKSNHRIQVADIIKQLHPKSKAQRRAEEEKFMREWQAEEELYRGGEELGGHENSGNDNSRQW